jgi:predicted lipid carrier protein YhbT
MASLEECHAALEGLAARLATVDDEERRHHTFDRSLSCRVPDLDVTFSGALSDGHITDITTDPAPRAQIRLTSGSDDLVALTNGDLDFGKAWLTGRIKVEAGVRDLLKLRSML